MDRAVFWKEFWKELEFVWHGSHASCLMNYPDLTLQVLAISIYAIFLLQETYPHTCRRPS